MVKGQVGPPTETVTPLKIDCYGFFVFCLATYWQQILCFFVCWFQEKEKNPTQNFEIRPPIPKNKSVFFLGVLVENDSVTKTF